ncbi:MAG TPA: DUF499 domain-containing protein [Gemmataceae bacterium]|nr:DUF499 domain-containing protein [Gemmataceae bacterium]
MASTRSPWKPWHKVVQLRSDLRAGELSLAVFAADLYDVVMGKARKVYADPKEFFALTYPTFNLRELAKDVVTRLAGKNDKAIRQLELTYGGGKTHTEITLYHLTRDPDSLPDLPAVQEFLQHIGRTPPRTQVAVLAFDKLDAEKGMEVRGPQGETRWLKNPWSVLAFQLAGVDGLKQLHPKGLDEERDSAPAEPLLEDLLRTPAQKGLSTLVLIDETLMYVREKVGLDPVWRGRLVNFFQYLTQAATKVDTCCVVASLLATDPHKSDTLGKELVNELYAIFRREREEGVQPVLKEDVAEVLRRRFFTPESIRDREAFRPHVVAALKGIMDLDEQTRKDGKAAENRFLASYPFHPDLTEVFYTKWTQLESFQRTRGILRTFALGLRDAERWDHCPLLAANLFLGDPRIEGLSQAARELATTAATEEYEGRKQEWSTILEGELAKARDLQAETPGVNFRELEQAVFATFLHSQPIGQKASLRNLLLLVGPTRPDRIELEKALRRWADVSWFLDEADFGEAQRGDGPRPLPKVWRLGSRPNLTQMHHDACTRVSGDLIEAKLVAEIGKLKNLTMGAKEAGAKVHVLPERPKDVEDDGEFHFAVLGPKAVSSSGSPSAEARRYLDETAAADRPRVHRNAVVLAVPSREGLDVARTRIRDYLGWEDVRHQLKDQDVDPLRQETLAASLEAARKKVPEAVLSMYGVVVTVSDKNEAQAFKLTVDPSKPLFGQILTDGRSRIQEAAISADALLPEGPYNLWRGGETARRVKDLAGAFAQFPHLPKMLRRKEILDTLVQGARDGFFVLRVTNPDRTARTFWRQEPDEAALRDPSLELVLPEAAELTELPPSLLLPKALPGLWASDEVTVHTMRVYFSGGNVVQVPRQGYEEPLTIPKADRSVVEVALAKAVEQGQLWLIAGMASLCGEAVPVGVLADDGRLQAPLPSLPATEVLPAQLPAVWASGEVTTVTAIVEGLSQKVGKPLPWPLVRTALNAAFQTRMLERTVDSGPWPCDLAGAAHVRVCVPGKAPVEPPIIKPVEVPKKPGVLVAEADLRPSQIQDLADQLGELTKAVVGYDLKLHLRIEVGGVKTVPPELVAKLNAMLAEVAKEMQFE